MDIGGRVVELLRRVVAGRAAVGGIVAGRHALAVEQPAAPLDRGIVGLVLGRRLDRRTGAEREGGERGDFTDRHLVLDPVAIEIGGAGRQLVRGHREVEVERVAHEVAHARGDPLPLERPDDEVAADTVDLAAIFVELRVGAAGAELVEEDLARAGAHGGAVDAEIGALGLEPDLVDHARIGSGGLQRAVARIDQVEGHFLGDALGIAGTEDMRRVAQEHREHGVGVLVAVGDERIAHPVGRRGLSHRVDDRRGGDGARAREPVGARGTRLGPCRIGVGIHAGDRVAFEAGLAVEPVDPHPRQLGKGGHGAVRALFLALDLARAVGALAVAILGGEALGEQVAADLHHLAEADIAGADVVLVDPDARDQRRPVGVGQAEGNVAVIRRRGRGGVGGSVGTRIRGRRFRLRVSGGIGRRRFRRRDGVRAGVGSGGVGGHRGRGRCPVPALQDRVDVTLARRLRPDRRGETAGYDERQGGNG